VPIQPWFTDAKLGIFVHWGIYAVDGLAESWPLNDGSVAPEQYMRQLDGFTAADYDPSAWADLFARAGARYAVLTARHHDGVALWNTRFGELSVVTRTPAGRDLISGYAAAMREKGLKVGLYYSLPDWSHPDYPTVRHSDPDKVDQNPVVSPEGVEDPAAWNRYLTYSEGQLRELLHGYQPDLLWFDGEWERSAEQWRSREWAELIGAANPRTVVNGRLLGYGDYSTPEQGMPVTAPDGPWELCLTINDSWSYRPTDLDYKSVTQLVRYFAETIGMGGNLLLGVGPRPDGTIPAEQVRRVEGLGDWIAAHAEAVYGTGAGLPAGHHYGPSMLSADRRTLYLVCFDIPREVVGVRGLRNPIKSARVVGSGEVLGHHVTGQLDAVPGISWIEAPILTDVDDHATVIAVELDGELDLYRGRGRS
jgi:alpha-L-fucosidase